MSTIKSLAQEMLDNFTSDKRSDDTTYYHTKEEIEWQRDLIFACHENGERLPEDETYEQIYWTLNAIVDRDNENPEDVGELELESDPYYHDLLKWLSSHLNNADYIDRYVEEFGLSSDKNGAIKDFRIFDLIAKGQWLWKEEIAGILLNGLKERAEKLDNTEVETDN
jgi:hypothetical protein